MLGKNAGRRESAGRRGGSAPRIERGAPVGLAVVGRGVGGCGNVGGGIPEGKVLDDGGPEADEHRGEVNCRTRGAIGARAASERRRSEEGEPQEDEGGATG
jgi:hypothetical protein